MNQNFVQKKNILVSIIMLLFSAACNGAASSTSSPSSVVEAYLNALVEKDNTTLSTLSCSSWESDALMELDSLQAVEVRLDGLICSDAGSNDEFSLVKCQGNIIATYNGENQSIDLSTRNYQVINQGGEFLVCGYQ
jgi:hypothetical protein